MTFAKSVWGGVRLCLLPCVSVQLAGRHPIDPMRDEHSRCGEPHRGDDHPLRLELPLVERLKASGVGRLGRKVELCEESRANLGGWGWGG